MDIIIVMLSVAGIVLEEMKSAVIPINPTIIRVMRVLRIARGRSVVSQINVEGHHHLTFGFVLFMFWNFSHIYSEIKYHVFMFV